MNNYYSIIFLIIVGHNGIVYCMGESSFALNSLPIKKKILILTSLKEFGNFVASKAMENYLHDDYDVQLCPAFKEVLAPVDPFNFLSLRQFCGEEFYNIFVSRKYYRLLGWLYYFGTWYIQFQKEKIHCLLEDYFIKTKPDLIISVIPVINNIVLEVAEKHNIPFLLMPTDLDIRAYIINLINPTYKKFYMGLMLDNPDTMSLVNGAHIAQEHVHTIGVPIRPEFLLQKNKNELKREYGIEQNKKVIMVLMGSQGSDEIHFYIAELLKLSQPFHLLACIGKNEQSRETISTLKIPSHISMSIIGFTKNIADYMSLADLLITKSGTLSIGEALYKNVPLFLDKTSTLLPWEEFNHDFIKKNECGMSITNYLEVVPVITRMLTNENELDKYKNNSKQLEKRDFSQEFKKLVEKILSNDHT